jgi:DNA adenine methylase
MNRITVGDMPIKALAPWFGGKRNLAPRIVAELGEHRVYWEPFCGSMAVLLAKPQCVMETVNDLHAGLVNLARVIQHPTLGAMLYRQLRRTLMCEDIFNDASQEAREDEKRGFVQQILDDGILPTDSDRLLCAYDYFVTSWLGRNGCAGQRQGKTGSYCVRYTANGGHAAKRWNSAIRSIPAWRKRMASVTILNRDGFDLLERIDDAEGVAIYIDPPYLVKRAKYMHDFEQHDHNRLAASLKRFKKARLVVSYYEHPDLAEMYPGWSKISVEVSKALSNANSRGGQKGRATEVMLINGPSFNQPPDATLFAGTAGTDAK